MDENDNDMAKLVDSIQREGLLERIVVQRRKEGGFEILSGHRRHRACQMLGLKEVPVLIKHGLTQDQAILLMVDANLKRENILPLDEAKALKMQMDAMNRMGKRDPNGKLKRTDEAIAEKINKNRMYVQRKVKLLDLAPDLKNAVNDKTLSETPAYEIAFLPAAVQELFYDWMMMEDRAPTVAQAIAVRQHQQELVKTTGKGKEKDALLTEDQIDRIMNGERLAEIFPPPEPEKEEQAQAEKETAGSQAPAAGAAKVESPAAIAGQVPAQGEQGAGQAQPGAAADAKAIPFQTVNTPEPGRSTYNSAAPAPEPPAGQPVPQAGPAVDATKSYIRTEYMAELRKDNVILPKVEIKGYVSGCYTNSDYVAAITAALAKGKEQGAKAVEPKPARPLNAVSTPTTEIINRVEAREVAEKAAKTLSTPPPAPEPPKADAKAPATSPASAEPPKAEKTTVTALAKPDPPNSGTKALDDFLKNKPRPGKSKGEPEKGPGKAK